MKLKTVLIGSVLLMAAGMICGITALILLMAEPNECEGFAECLCVLIASKIGAVACGLAAYVQLKKLTEETKK